MRGAGRTARLRLPLIPLVLALLAGGVLGAMFFGGLWWTVRRGAASVVSVDTGYGILDWRLRNDPRVEVRERTNALHDEPRCRHVAGCIECDAIIDAPRIFDD